MSRTFREATKKKLYEVMQTSEGKLLKTSRQYKNKMTCINKEVSDALTKATRKRNTSERRMHSLQRMHQDELKKEKSLLYITERNMTKTIVPLKTKS